MSDLSDRLGDLAAERLVDVEGVGDFLDLCDLDAWAREQMERPTLAERVEEMDWDDCDPSDR